MKEPWIRVVKRRNLEKRNIDPPSGGDRAGSGGRRILYPADWAESICHLSDDCNRSAAKRDGDTGDGQNHDSTLIASLGVTLAFKMKFWNIGAEGQIIMGGIFASYFALFHANWNHWLLVIVMFLAGAIGGGLWGLIPAWFKTRYDTNETLFTLMLNYIALNVIVFLREGAWRDPGSQGYAKIARFNKNAALDKVFGIQFGWVIALILVVVIAVYLNRSKQGYEISVVGEPGDSPLCWHECKKWFCGRCFCPALSAASAAWCRRPVRMSR